jgi:hypothetical protein
MAYKMITLYPVVKRLRPEKHDWNEALQKMGHGMEDIKTIGL